MLKPLAGAILLATLAPHIALAAQDPAPTTLLADLNSALPSGQGFSSDMQVLGEAAGRLWLRAARPDIASRLWSLDAFDSEPRPWFLSSDSTV